MKKNTFSYRIKIMRVVLLALFTTLCCSSPPSGGVTGEPAEALLRKLYEAVNIKSWENTSAVRFLWKGSGEHAYLWDKKRKLVEVRWDDIVVQYAQRKSYKGIAWEDKKELKDSKKTEEYITQARKYFVNDAFWLNPVFHISSPGVQKYKISNNELLVSFTQGGVTPGDSYLFKLNENFLVEEMKMWVSILPVKGISVKFSNYITSKTGVKLALNHKISFLNVQIKNVMMHNKYPAEDGYDVFKASLLTD